MKKASCSFVLEHPLFAVVMAIMMPMANLVFAQNSPEGCIWLEGESAKTSFKVNRSGWGRTQFLSEEKWLHISVNQGDVGTQVPDHGVVLSYDFDVSRAGQYELWNRVGFEFVRSVFEWRIDDNAWQTVASDRLTTDLMEIAEWCEVAWLKLGEQTLSFGSHRLEIRLPKTKDDSGKWQRLIYASDAICLHPGSFRPNGKYKPGQSYRDAQDKAAARLKFKLPEAGSAQRSQVTLNGLWEVARHDEQKPGEVAEPLTQMPKGLFWRGISVPGDKNVQREDLIFAHRLWYRTRVAVPASMGGRVFYLDFPCNNLNTTVYVNGILCGFEKNPFVRFQVDLTPGIKPGQVNEIQVGIRDAWYGRSADPKRPLKLRKTFNLPLRLFSEGFQDFDYPVWNCPQSGILSTPTLIAAGGAVAVDDVFVKPSVAKQQLDVALTLRNTSDQDAVGQIQWAAVNEKTGRIEHRFKALSFNARVGQVQAIDLSETWENPTLWWPDAPFLYTLRTTVLLNGKPVDVKDTEFGFREWRCEGKKFTLNGIVWHMWADLVGVKSSPEAWLAAYRRTHQRTTRLSTAGQAGPETRWLGMEPHEALAFCDRNGVVVRRNTTLDGERIGYHFSEGDAETRKQQGGSELKLALMKNWRDQCVAQVKGERNHPSIQIWTIENEFAFINLINLLGNSKNMDLYEQEITKTHDAVLAVDPTRSVMIDGGGATKDNTLGVHGDHYVATLDARYPDLAYEPFAQGGGRGRWVWDEQRPRFLGEDWYATGINPADYAMWGGETTFQGKAATGDALALIYRMLTEGYRWGGHYAAWHFWLGHEGGDTQWGANPERAVFVRQWDWTFGSDQKVTRTFGVFNDTHYSDPITFSRRLTINGKDVYSKRTIHKTAPGTSEKFDEVIPMPVVTERTEAQLVLTLSVAGKEVFRDSKAVSVLPRVVSDDLKSKGLAVYDPSGGTAVALKRLGVPFHSVQSLDRLSKETKVLVVGSNAVKGDETTSTRLAAYASLGHAVVVLDQIHPLKYQAIPADIELAPWSRKNDFGTEVPTAEGCTAFIEDTSHPALLGLEDKDFFTWGQGHRVFHDAYVKPTRGGKSLVQCGPRLEYSALVEVPVGQGILVLCQLDMGDKLAHNSVAQQLLMNLIRTGQDYRLEYADVATVIKDDSLAKAIEAVGLQYTKAKDPMTALRDSHKKIVLVSATPAHLKAMASDQPALKRFWQGGGTLVLCGLTPDGLADYNRIVGVDHVIRSFKRERVSFPVVRNPLTAGLTVGDIVLLSGKRIFGWTKDEYVVSDMFNHVVNLDEMATFAKSRFSNYDNIVNGFVGSDGWPLIIDFEHPKDGTPYEIHMDLSQEETVVEYTHDQSINYNPTTRIALLFDGEDPVEFELNPKGESQTFAINPPRRAKRVTVQLLKWQSDPGKRPIIGIDNITLKVQRSSEWQASVKPMLNNGGLVEYKKGHGRVVLLNLNFQENEAVPINQTKKRTILATILRNLKAPFSGGKTVIVGADLTYTSLDIHTKATTYKDERGWFGNKATTFKSLPAGEHVFADVPYTVYEMPTSPVPQVLMLGGKNVPGHLPEQILDIPVKIKADALFFLHTARIDRRLNAREQKEKKQVELCRYVIHYADGQTVEVPILSEIDIDHYRQKSPRSIPGAQLAWTGKFENSEESAVLYAKQWNNPRPDATVASVDLVSGKDKDRGVPVLIAITAATLNEIPSERKTR